MADLKLTITENLTLNGAEQGGTYQKTISDITAFSKRIVSIAADDDATVLVFKSTTASADGALDLQNVKYIRITNLDSTNSVNMSLQIDSDEDNSAANESCTILLEAGMTFMMGTPEEGIHVNDDAATIITALTDLESIIIDSGTNAVQVEVFVASA